MIRTQIQIHSDQITWLKRRAVGQGVSMSHLIRDCIEFYRDHCEKNVRLKKVKERALTAVGSFSTVDSDHTSHD